MEKKKLWIVIPVWNEATHIAKVVNPLVTKGFNVLVVDDGSSDNSAKLAEEAGASILRLKKNSGKGNALRKGFDYALKIGAKFLITMDGDGQHDSDDVEKFVKKLDEKFEVVFSRRDFSMMPFLSKFGNWFLSFLARLFFGVVIRDTQSGMRGFTRGAYKICRWSSTDYRMESETVARVGLNGLKYCEVSIKTIYPKKIKGTTGLDGLKIMWSTIMWRLFPGKLVSK